MSSLYETTMKPETLNRLIEHVHTHTGIKITESKRSMLQGRIRNRINKLALKSYEEYLDFFEKNKDEIQDFINVITTNETSFYRTPRVWEYFSKDFLPNWYKKNPGKTLKIWSAAASSGEEGYTLSIFCREFKLLHADFQYQIIGTDISTEILKKAQADEYAQRSIENIRTKLPTLYAKYFSEQGEIFKVSSDIKSSVKFIPHNLFKPLRMSDKFNIVFIRNVMIYFEAADQEKVLLNIKISICD